MRYRRIAAESSVRVQSIRHQPVALQVVQFCRRFDGRRRGAPHGPPLNSDASSLQFVRDEPPPRWTSRERLRASHRSERAN
eukprot:1531799-Prymnesium_polylepis.1